MLIFIISFGRNSIINWSPKMICWIDKQILMARSRNICFCCVSQTFPCRSRKYSRTCASMLRRAVSSNKVYTVNWFVISWTNWWFPCQMINSWDFWHLNVGKIAMSGADIILGLTHLIECVCSRSRVLTNILITLAVLSIYLSGNLDLKAGARKSREGRLS